MNSDEFDREFDLEKSNYIIPSEIELTQDEITMLRSHGITVWEADKMSKEEIEDAYNWAIENGY
jgi:hypothetical protein